MEAGTLALHLQPLTFQAVAHDCIGFVDKLAAANRVRCSLEASLHCSVPVLADEGRLGQVLLNLLSNAIKYNRPGGEVRLRCEPGARDCLRLLVEDTGPGMSPEDLARLFVPFERLGRELGPVEGTGLGLVVARQLTEAMGGSLGATSQIGRGSTFWVELPTVGPAAPDQEELSEEGPASSRPRQSAPAAATLLYVEDNASNQQVVSTVVGRMRPNWRLLLASDGVDGLEQARSHRPDVILLDLQLPGKKGDAVLSELRDASDTRQTPVLILSADAMPSTRERLLALGATEYLAKPLDVADLLEKIDALLSSRPDKAH